jgi:hypothetical protein
VQTRANNGSIVVGDRYALDEFANLQYGFPLPSENSQLLLGKLLRRSEINYTNTIDLEQIELHAIPIHAHLENSTSANVGRFLLDLDIEIRRCVSYMLSGSQRPSRNYQLVEVISAEHVNSVEIVVGAALEAYNVLTSRPIAFLQLLDWLWSHRLNRTKVRRQFKVIDPRQLWEDLLRRAALCIELDRPVILTIGVGADDSTTFGLESR